MSEAMIPAIVLSRILVLMTSTHGFVLPGPTLGMIPTSCDYNGRVIPEMEYVYAVPCPDWRCQCIQGQLTACVYSGCPRRQCVDAVGPCCPRCPHGPNCYNYEQKIIPAGVEVRDGHSICRCVTNTYGSERLADCRPLPATSLAPPTPLPDTN